MGKYKLFLIAFALLLKVGALSSQIVSGIDDINRSSSISVRLDALPICNEDFENYHYNHFLPPEGFRDIKEERSMPYFSLYEHKGKVKSLQVNAYNLKKEFGEEKKIMKAYNKAIFNESGKVIDLDYKPQFNSGYNSYDVFKIIGDGNLSQYEAEYNEEGRVSRRYLRDDKRVYMDYGYDNSGRVVKITFDTGDYSDDGTNITTIKYDYDTREGHENYITHIESFIGTKKREEATLNYSLTDLRLESVIIKDDNIGLERTWEYEYDEDGQFVKIVNIQTNYGKHTMTVTNYFERMWGAGSNSLRCDNRRVSKNQTGYENENGDTYIFTFDEQNNWILLESDYGIFERKIEYFENTDSNVSDNFCLKCEKNLAKNTAFCEHCGAEQATILAKKQWKKRQEEIRLSEEKQKKEEESQVENNSDSDSIDGTIVTNTEEESDNMFLIFSVIGILIVIGILLFKFKKK